MTNIINIEAMRESAIHTASIQTLQSQIAKLLTEEESSERAVKLAALYAKQATAMRQHNAALKREEKETAVPSGGSRQGSDTDYQARWSQQESNQEDYAATATSLGMK